MEVKLIKSGEIVHVDPTGVKNESGDDLYIYVKESKPIICTIKDFDVIQTSSGNSDQNREIEYIEERKEDNSDYLDANKNSKTDRNIIFALIIIAVVVTFIAITQRLCSNSESTKILPDTTTTANIALEKAKIDSINEIRQKEVAKKREETIMNSIKITSAYVSRPNYADGCDVYFYYKNLSDKTIKYLVWESSFLNAVGDHVRCSIRDEFRFRGRDTGPIKKNKSGGGLWDCVIYNSTASKLDLESVEIEYMDGSTLILSKDEIKKVRK